MKANLYLKAGVVVFAGVWASGALAQEQASRIVSLNLCADQYLLEIAEHSQIAALTRNAADPQMSAAYQKVGNARLLRPTAEELLALRPDYVVGLPASTHPLTQALPRRNARMLDLQRSESLEDIYAQLRAVGKALDRPEKAEAIVKKMEADLAAIPKIGRGRVAAYYQRRGYVTGTGTLIDDLMQRVGLRNLAGVLDKPALSQLSVEEMVAAKPDFLIVEAATNEVSDQGTEMLHHPALRHIPRISLKQAWTVCGSPAYVLAAKSLVMQIRKHDGLDAPRFQPKQNTSRTLASAVLGQQRKSS